MVAFATVEQMEARSRGSVTVSSHPYLARELEAASQAIRNACGWHIAPAQTVPFRRSSRIPSVVFLPGMNITAVTAAKVNGVTVDPAEVTADPDTGETNLYGRIIDVSFTCGYALDEYTPERLSFTFGYTVDLSRSGDVVTAVVTSNGATPTAQALAIPARFAPLGVVRLAEYNDPTAPSFVVTINDVPALGALGISLTPNAIPTGTTITLQWVGDPVPGNGSAVADLSSLVLDMVAASLGGGAEGLAREQAGAVSVTYKQYADSELNGRLSAYRLGWIP